MRHWFTNFTMSLMWVSAKVLFIRLKPCTPGFRQIAADWDQFRCTCTGQGSTTFRKFWARSAHWGKLGVSRTPVFLAKRDDFLATSQPALCTCVRRTLCRHMTIGTPMVIFAVWLFLTIGTLLVQYCNVAPVSCNVARVSCNITARRGTWR